MAKPAIAICGGGLVQQGPLTASNNEYKTIFFYIKVKKQGLIFFMEYYVDCSFYQFVEDLRFF